MHYMETMEYVSWHAIFFKDIEIIYKYFWREMDKYKEEAAFFKKKVNFTKYWAICVQEGTLLSSRETPLYSSQRITCVKFNNKILL